MKYAMPERDFHKQTDDVMENSIFIGLSRQMVLQDNMDIVANNLANMNTPGFRGQNLVFNEYISEPRGQEDPIRMVYDHTQYQVTEPGPVKRTGNSLDVAINGPAFFGVQSADGTGVRYTRAGNFSVNANGELITPSGHLVADQGGGTITIPDDASEINIDKNGSISTQDGEIARLMVVEFDNVQTLYPEGNGLYAVDGDAVPMPAANSTVEQGMLEGSNIEPVIEMTRMIEISREYQKVQKILENEHERQRTLIQKMTGNS